MDIDQTDMKVYGSDYIVEVKGQGRTVGHTASHKHMFMFSSQDH